MTPDPRPLAAINYHCIRPCNADCHFCFATFRGVVGQLSTDDAKRLLTSLRRPYAQKITFAGGEPTLRADLPELIRFAKELGYTTSVVTNGFRLDRVLDRVADALDWVGLSVDSADEDTQRALGRGPGDHVRNAVALAVRCHALGVRLKINTVVTALNADEDLTDFLRLVRPERWKVFQVLRVVGQNDGRVEPLLIEPDVFAAYVARHQHLAAEGLAPVHESNEAMLDSYVMIDPKGRFYGDTGGVHRESRPILDVGVDVALREVGFELDKLVARGGIYSWE